MSYLKIVLAGFALMAAMPAGGSADAAEIRVLSSGSLKAALSQLLPDFQRSSGNAATIEYGPAGAIVGRVEKGDAADVVIVSRSQLQKLESNGKVVQGSLVNIAGICAWGCRAQGSAQTGYQQCRGVQTRAALGPVDWISRPDNGFDVRHLYGQPARAARHRTRFEAKARSRQIRGRCSRERFPGSCEGRNRNANRPDHRDCHRARRRSCWSTPWRDSEYHFDGSRDQHHH